MDKKLTLRLNGALIEHAKQHADRAGKSVSQMFANFVMALDGLEKKKEMDVDELLPITRSPLGMLKSDREDDDKQSYHDHIAEKYR